VNQAATKQAGDGYSASTVEELTGASQKLLASWDARGIFSPSIQAAGGTGTWRRYSRNDLVSLRVISVLRFMGLDFSAISPFLIAIRGMGDLFALPGNPVLIGSGNGEVLVRDEDDRDDGSDDLYTYVRVRLWFYIRAMRAAIEAHQAGHEGPILDAAMQMTSQRARSPRGQAKALASYAAHLREKSIAEAMAAARRNDNGQADGQCDGDSTTIGPDRAESEATAA
jgi:hypothetical protein